MIQYLKEHRKFLLIIAGILALNYCYGFDARFTIINVLWMLINVVKL